MTESSGSAVAGFAAVSARQPGDPTQVGQYVVLGRLGAGGMGTVFLARRSDTGSGTAGMLVAVKVVHPELTGDAAFRARFREEVAAARRVAPFCTARVVDADPEANPPYLVTEFVDGLSLSRAVTERGPLAGSTLHGMALGVAAALAAIHNAGVVHRDLKPANVLLSMSGPRVIDFGIARALDATQGLTKVGTVLGTPGWMAPEQFHHGAVGPPADVFSWGSLVAFAATGANPWGSEGPPAALAYRIVHGAPNLQGLDGPLRTLVDAALQKDPARRPTARQLVLALLGDEPVGGQRGFGLAADPAAAATAEATQLMRGWAPPLSRTRVLPPAPARPAPVWRAPMPRAPLGPVPLGSVPPGSGPPGPVGVVPPAGPRGPAGSVPPAPVQAVPARPPWRPWRRAGHRTTRPPAGRQPAAPPSAQPTRRLPVPQPAPHTAAQPYPPAGQAPRRRRRWYRKKRYLLPLALLAALMLVPGSREKSARDGAGSGQASPSATGAAVPTSDLGRPVRDGQLEFVVSRWQCGLPALGEEPLVREARGQFCLATVQARNIGREPRTLFEPFQKLVAADGSSHSSDISARFVLPGQTLWDQVNPGQTVQGSMAFDVSRTIQPVRLVLHDGPLSRGVRVRLPGS